MYNSHNIASIVHQLHVNRFKCDSATQSKRIRCLSCMSRSKQTAVDSLSVVDDIRVLEHSLQVVLGRADRALMVAHAIALDRISGIDSELL